MVWYRKLIDRLSYLIDRNGGKAHIPVKFNQTKEVRRKLEGAVFAISFAISLLCAKGRDKISEISE